MRNTMYQKASFLLVGTGICKVNSVACGFSSIKIDYSDYLKSLISRINDLLWRKPNLDSHCRLQVFLRSLRRISRKKKLA